MVAKNSRRWDYFFTMGRLWMVLVMFVSCLSPVYSDPSQEESISYFVTLPTEKSLFSPYEEASENYYETESPITTMQPNSARLQQYEDDAKISFLADVPEVVGELEQHQKFKSLVDLPLFPNTRTGTVTGRTVERSRRPGAQNYRGDDDNVDNDRISGKDDDDEGKLGLIVRPKQNQENIGSRHSSVSNRYRPDRFPSLPPRQRPRPRPPLSGHHVPGSSVIDKERIFHNDIYPGRPGGNLRRPPFRNMTRVTHIEAECQDDFMRIHVQFNGTFDGLIYSSGYAYDGECIYVNGSGRPVYEFYIQLNRCGTLSGNEKGKEDVRGRTPTKNVMWNTLTVQYNALIEEEWDEHFKVTCEYGYDFWKTVTFPFLDVEVQTGNPVVFTLTPPECHMEIRHGFGTTGGRVSGPVRVGDPLTLVIYMRSDFEGFDIVVSDCYAHNGGNKKITLIDHYGCPVDEKLISHFEGTWTSEGIYETQVYAFMKTFRFTGSPALYIECDVRMCHGNCPTQPCHWRTGKKEKRSISEADGTIPSSNVSESLSLFQSIQVVRDDHLLQNPLSDLDEVDVCLKTGTVSALGGMVAVVVGLLTVACGVMCMRLRRMKKQEDAHHPGSSNRPHSMTFVPPYKSDFVPPVKRRLE